MQPGSAQCPLRVPGRCTELSAPAPLSLNHCPGGISVADPGGPVLRARQQGKVPQGSGPASSPAAQGQLFRMTQVVVLGTIIRWKKMQMTRKLREYISFYHLLRLETRPVIYSFLMKYKDLGPSCLGPGKFICKHEVDYVGARWRWGFNCTAFIECLQCARSGKESRGAIRYNPPL